MISPKIAIFQMTAIDVGHRYLCRLFSKYYTPPRTPKISELKSQVLKPTLLS